MSPLPHMHSWMIIRQTWSKRTIRLQMRGRAPHTHKMRHRGWLSYWAQYRWRVIFFYIILRYTAMSILLICVQPQTAVADEANKLKTVLFWTKRRVLYHAGYQELSERDRHFRKASRGNPKAAGLKRQSLNRARKIESWTVKFEGLHLISQK